MGTPSMPAAFAFLADESNPAVDAALVEALPTLDPNAQAAGMEILTRRADTSALTDLVGRFSKYGESLQRLIVESVTDLSSALRSAISSTTEEYHAGAIEVIVRSGAARQAYLLADALREQSPQTRELSAQALFRMTADLLDRLADGPSGSSLAELNAQADALGEALRTAVRRFEIHLQPKVVEAAIWMAEWTESAIVDKLRQPRSKLGHLLIDMIGSTSDARKAGFVIRALALPELRSSAAAALSRSPHPTFIRAVVAHSWLLADVEIERGCRRIRDLSLSPESLGDSGLGGEAATAGLVGLLAASGGSQTGKSEALRDLLGRGRADIPQAVVWRLIHDDSESATEVLSIVAARPGDRASIMATRELRRRGSGANPEFGPQRAIDAGSTATAGHSLFEEYWIRFDELEKSQRTDLEARIRRHPEPVGHLLRGRMGSSSPLDRARALRLASRLELVQEVRESVYRLASDPDPIVRSLAVGTLAQLPGASSERLLRNAVNDPDERVQANAVEALDRLNVADRVRCTQPKLDSTNSRIRANAVRSLLRAELRAAGDTLLCMLESDSASDRLGALWVVEQLCLRSVLHRVAALGRHDTDDRVRQRAVAVVATLTSSSPAEQTDDSAATRSHADPASTGMVQ